MPGLSNPRQNGAILVGLLLAQLLLMSASVRGADGATRLESWLMRFSSPLVATGRLLGGGFGGATGGVRELWTARSRNQALETELTRLRREVTRDREAVLENGRLRRLLGMREEWIPRSIAATVVTSTMDSQTRMIVVDRGTRDGVGPDLPVLAWGGAVGRVVIAGPDHAKVLLITDPNSGVAGVVQRSRAQGIVFGRGELTLELRYVPKFADVVHGDRIITSGLDGIFPRGFGLGRIIAVGDSSEGAHAIELEPELDFGRLEEVLIVLERQGEPQSDVASSAELP